VNWVTIPRLNSTPDVLFTSPPGIEENALLTLSPKVSAISSCAVVTALRARTSGNRLDVPL
jgi:hypothetical protein